MSAENKTLALTEDDVNNVLKKLTDANMDEINSIFDDASRAVNAIISRATKEATDESEIVELERIKRIVNLAPKEEKFIRMKDKVWKVREHILNKNADYFFKKDYSEFIKKDHNQVFLENIVEIICQKFKQLNESEQEFYWNKALILLQCVLKFKKITGDY